MFQFRQAPVHWSKDFVEHLRTVHFALIAVSAALIVLVLSSKQYNAVTALVQIEEIIELKRNWSADWIIEHGDAIVSKDLATDDSCDTNDFLTDADFDEPAAERRKDREPSFYGQVLLTKPIGSPGGTWNSPGKRIVLKCLFPKDRWYQLNHTAPDWSPKTFPATLSQFRVWWGLLRSGQYAIYVPTRFSSSGCVRFVVEKRGRFLKGTLGADENTPQAEIQLSLNPDREEGRVPEDKGPFNYVAELKWPVYLWIPIIEMTRYGVTRNTIISRFSTMGSGEFEQAFSDLSHATDGMADLELGDIKEFIHDDAAKGPEVFEIFGMKFPAGQATFWGMVLLLSVQLYFLTYLRQLSGKLRAEDPGWEVPWIAMDPSTVAQFMFFITLVPLPLAALGLLAGKRILFILSTSSLAGHPGLLTVVHSLPPIAKTEIGVLVYAFCASGVLAISRWRYRPKLIPSAPTPRSLFE
jgi:hypothetical protein